MAIMKYAIVQHSAFGYKGDRTFEQGLEQRVVTTKKEADAIEKAGGILFDTYGEADDFCDMVMYPEDDAGLTPSAKGTFADLKVDGLAVYIPRRVMS